MNENNVFISICPFDRTPCRGPECPLLVYQDSDNGWIYYCGLNHYCPEGCYAFPVTPASRARRSPRTYTGADGRFST